MEHNNMSGRSRVEHKVKIILVALVVLIVILVMGVRTYQKSIQVKQENLILSSQKINEQTKESVLAFTTHFENLANTLATDSNISGHKSTSDDGAQLMKIFDNVRKSQVEILNIYMGDVGRKMINSPKLDLPRDYDPTGRSWYKAAVEKGDLIWTEPYTNIVNGNIIISCAKPIYDVKKNLVGVLGMDLELTKIMKKVNAIKIGKKGYSMIVDRNGIVIISKNAQAVGRQVGIKAIADCIANKMDVIQTMRVSSDGKNNREVATVTKVDELGWYIVSVMNTDDWK